MEQREGFVEHIVYRNPDNGYSVLSISDRTSGEELTCVGNFPFLNEGEYLRVTGELTNHAVYGEQLKVVSYEIAEPQDVTAMERYLGSGAIKGVGAVMAMKIVEKFKGDTFRIIEREPERLAEIRGISVRMAQSINEQFLEKQSMRRVMLFLQQYGIGMNLALKIYQKYGDNTEQVLRDNPYRIAEDLSGIGFRTADEIAMRMGGYTDSRFRLRACILYVLQTANQSGHAYLPKTSLKRHIADFLTADDGELDTALIDLIADRKLRTTDDITDINGNPESAIYPSIYYYVENSIARMLLDTDVEFEVSDARLDADLRSVSSGYGIELDGTQKAAVREAVKHGIFILTGGPGTGKTTTINAIIRVLEKQGLEVALAAPTGRAAKRMTEATDHEALTLHRLLEVTHVSDEGTPGSAKFNRDQDNPLEVDAVIVDEMSMVDMHLMNALLKAIVPGMTRLILVGDANQLPSVGPGNVLRDLLDSRAFASVELTKIFRQAEESDIVVNAHRINRGEMPKLDNRSRDFFLMKRNDTNVIRDVMVQLVRDKIPDYVHANPYDVQVLTPMRKGELGVENLNALLQQMLNPPNSTKVEREAHGVVFRVGDKVMQVKNNYQLEWEIRTERNTLLDNGTGVFNGDIGTIRNINNFAEEMEIVFDENRVVYYPFSSLEDLEHAYAVTIHKSQGSEYPAVVIPLLTGPRMLFNRNLLYTGVTRASKCVIIVGSEAAVKRMVENADEQKRYTGLMKRIQEQKREDDRYPTE